jgi:hypothetical protein
VRGPRRCPKIPALYRTIHRSNISPLTFCILHSYKVMAQREKSLHKNNQFFCPVPLPRNNFTIVQASFYWVEVATFLVKVSFIIPIFCLGMNQSIWRRHCRSWPKVSKEQKVMCEHKSSSTDLRFYKPRLHNFKF